MEQLSPLATLANWLKQQQEDAQNDIAFGVAALMDDDGWSKSGEVLRAAMFNLLDDREELPLRVVGRTIAFKSCLEYFCRSRFHAEGWEDNEDMFRSVISEAATDHESEAAQIAFSAFQMLRQLPARREMWLAVGKSWSALVEEHLSDDALDRWRSAEIRHPE
jgi:hypothetical protein